MSGNMEYIAPSNELNKTLMYNNGFCFVLKKKGYCHYVSIWNGIHLYFRWREDVISPSSLLMAI